MFELVFLGTSASAPSIRRGLSSAMVIYNEFRFLIDCGEGTQRQLLKSGLGFRRLNRILLTHGHLDHILGLGGLLSTFARWEAVDELEVYGGKQTLDRVAALMAVVFGTRKPPLNLEFIDLKPGIILEDNKFELTAFSVNHRGPDCLGFCFREKSKRPFLVDKAEALGVPAGPERARLVRGETVELADGHTIRPDDVLGDAVPGAKLVFVGDAGETDSLVETARDADLLVIEATYLEVEEDLARDFGHLTAARSAMLARRANVKNLILTHISRRYTEREVLVEARPIFENTFVARDLSHYRITREKVARMPRQWDNESIERE